MKKIVAFGEVVWDILPNGRILGGTPLNMVFRWNSFGGEGFLLSRLGFDNSGHDALDELNKLGISDKNIQIDDEFPTGIVNISFDEQKEPRYEVIEDVAFDHIEFSSASLKLARSTDCLFYGLLPQRFGLSKNTLRELLKESSDSIHFFDLKLFEHFFDKNVVENLLLNSNIVRIKEKEINFLGKELEINHSGDIEKFGAIFSEKYKLDIVLITRGASGVFAYHKTEGMFYDAGYIIDVVDNIGSGVAFIAAFLHYFLNGKNIRESLSFGNAAGALNTTLRGATSFFDKNDVFRFMERAKQNS